MEEGPQRKLLEIGMLSDPMEEDVIDESSATILAWLLPVVSILAIIFCCFCAYVLSPSLIRLCRRLDHSTLRSDKQPLLQNTICKMEMRMAEMRKLEFYHIQFPVDEQVVTEVKPGSLVSLHVRELGNSSMTSRSESIHKTKLAKESDNPAVFTQYEISTKQEVPAQLSDDGNDSQDGSETQTLTAMNSSSLNTIESSVADNNQSIQNFILSDSGAVGDSSQKTTVIPALSALQHSSAMQRGIDAHLRHLSGLLEPPPGSVGVDDFCVAGVSFFAEGQCICDISETGNLSAEVLHIFGERTGNDDIQTLLNRKSASDEMRHWDKQYLTEECTIHKQGVYVVDQPFTRNFSEPIRNYKNIGLPRESQLSMRTNGSLQGSDGSGEINISI